ncbi:MAG: hypothetical protein ACTIA6_04840 [Pseudoclavibacter sp.]
MSHERATTAGTSRRAVMGAAAWSVPVIAAAVAAPLSVASTAACVELPLTQTSWTVEDPRSGRNQGAGANNSWRTVDGRLGYRQYNDNFYRITNPAAVDYTSAVSVDFTATVGTTYVFTFFLLGNVAAAQTQIVTTLDIVVGGTSLQRFSTKPAQSAGTQVPMGPVNATTGSVEFTVSWTADVSGATTFDYLFTMPPVAANGVTYNDDIWVSLPVVSQPAGCVPTTA